MPGVRGQRNERTKPIQRMQKVKINICLQKKPHKKSNSNTMRNRKLKNCVKKHGKIIYSSTGEGGGKKHFVRCLSSAAASPFAIQWITHKGPLLVGRGRVRTTYHYYYYKKCPMVASLDMVFTATRPIFPCTRQRPVG